MCLCMSVFVGTCVRVSAEARRECQIHGAGVTSGCKPPRWVPGNELWSSARTAVSYLLSQVQLVSPAPECDINLHFL